MSKLLALAVFPACMALLCACDLSDKGMSQQEARELAAKHWNDNAVGKIRLADGALIPDIGLTADSWQHVAKTQSGEWELSVVTPNGARIDARIDRSGEIVTTYTVWPMDTVLQPQLTKPPKDGGAEAAQVNGHGRPD